MADNSSTGHKRRFSRKSWIILLLIIAGLILFAYAIYNNSTQLSQKDFDVVETKMDNVYSAMDLPEVDKARSCYNYKDSMSTVLKCSIEIAGYIPVVEQSEIDRVTKNFEDQLLSMSSTHDILRMASGLTGTNDRSGTFVVKDGKLVLGCWVTVKTGGSNVQLSRALPEKDFTGKIALVLACGGASHEPYFDMH